MFDAIGNDQRNCYLDRKQGKSIVSTDKAKVTTRGTFVLSSKENNFA